MDRILSNLGLCNKARGLVSGEEMICTSLASGKIKYIFLAHDASSGAKKKILYKSEY